MIDYPPLVEARMAYDELIAENPAARPGYRKAEVAIDLFRLSVPAVTAVWAIVQYLSSRLAL